ncbi:BTAD domain-containing putative transcriptional regulator [Streptomyces sp. NPDC046197]|uniref:BTAD domain-containing putative transcriptional regulator n=1 Tax=Streptomyces sp. NPDC046197 TaxID=3154337 RepID=UPI003409BAE6
MTARCGSEQVHLGPPRHRAVLGLLLLRLGQVVRADQLVDELWGEHPPRRPHATLQTYMSHLRRALTSKRGPDKTAAPLHYRAPGYVLTLEAGAVDLYRFDQLVARGQAHASEGRFELARDLLGSALELWQADPFLDLTSYAPLAEEGARLQHLRTAAVAARADALLALGETGDAVAALRREVTRCPTDERMVAGLMTGLYRLGQQAEALRLYDRTRTQLSEELGVAPSGELQRVHLAILRHELGDISPAPRRIEARSHPQEAERASDGARDPGRPARIGPGSGAGSARVTGADVAGTSELGRRGPAPDSPLFEGREHALAAVRLSVTAALRGSGHLTAVVGEAGAGKTELLARATTGTDEWVEGTKVIRVSCRNTQGTPEGWVWHQVLRQLTAPGGVSNDAVAPPCSHDAMTTLSGQEAAPADDGRVARMHFLAHDALCESILRHADDTPLLLVVEDVHRADHPTLDMLGLLSGRTHGRSMSVVISAREPGLGTDPEPDGPLQELLADSRAEVVHLDNLSEDHVHALVAAQAGPGLDAAVVRGLYERSGGNPYLLGRLLAHAGGARRLHDAHASESALTGIPTGVRSMLRRRLAALAPRVLRVLRSCAVLGPEAEMTLLTGVLGDGDGDGDPDAQAVEEALRTGLLRRDRDQSHGLAFRHGLVRDVLLDEMTDRERAALHIRAVDVLSARVGGCPEVTPRLAHHAWQAALTLPTDQVLPHLLRAGEQAAVEGGYDSARTWFRRARTLLSSTPPTSGTTAQALYLSRRILQIDSVTRGYGDREVEAESQRILRLSAATAALAAEEPALLFLQCIAKLVTGRHEEGSRRVEQLRVLAEESDAPEVRLHERLARGILHLPSRPAEALTALTEAERTAESLSPRHLARLTHRTQHDPRFLAMNHRVLTLWLLGATDQALGLSEDLLLLTGHEGTPVDRASAHYFHALVAALAEEPDAVAASSARGLEIARAHGLLHWTSMLQVCHSWAQHQLGAPDALDALESAVDELSERQLRIRLPLHLGLLAQAQHGAGAVEAARETLRRSAREIKSRGEYAYLSPDLPFNRLPRLRLVSGGQ